MNKNFSISLIVPTLNNAKNLPQFFMLISRQKYPKDKIEIIVSDGGSTDDTLKIAKKFGARIYKNKKVLAEPGVTLGMSKANGDILIILATDNYLDDPLSLSKYSKTFSDDMVYAAFPRHQSDQSDSIFTRYINTFTDPFNHFVYGYASNGRYFNRIYETLISNEVYDIYDFSSSAEIPLIAFAQGFAIRSSYKRQRIDALDDIMPVMEILGGGKRVAFIHSVPLFHHTVKDLGHFVRKQRWATRNALEKRRYGIAHRSSRLSSNQQFRMRIWPAYALSILPPIVYSFINLIRDRNVMWLCHPFMCFLSSGASLYEVLVYNVFGREAVSRQ